MAAELVGLMIIGIAAFVGAVFGIVIAKIKQRDTFNYLHGDVGFEQTKQPILYKKSRKKLFRRKGRQSPFYLEEPKEDMEQQFKQMKKIVEEANKTIKKKKTKNKTMKKPVKKKVKK